jgi:hypothetical protein
MPLFFEGFMEFKGGGGLLNFSKRGTSRFSPLRERIRSSGVRGTGFFNLLKSPFENQPSYKFPFEHTSFSQDTVLSQSTSQTVWHRYGTSWSRVLRVQEETETTRVARKT